MIEFKAWFMVVNTDKGFTLIKYSPNIKLFPLFYPMRYEPIDESEKFDAFYAEAEKTLIYLPNEMEHSVGKDTIATKIEARPFDNDGDIQLNFQKAITNYLQDIFKCKIEVLGIDE